jgi:tryptophan-rich sensory protein
MECLKVYHMALLKRIILFLILNFSALAIGGLFTGSGVSSDWYTQLNKAPWTPPGWAFGAAWSLIMICFAVYMGYLFKTPSNRKKVILLFSFQWILNVAWNPIFFYYREVLLGLIDISLLTLLVGYLFFRYRKELNFKTIFLAPYLVWLLIATSLNAYILFFN